MKIYNTINSEIIECEPTQKALEDKNIDTFNMELSIKNNKGFLIPIETKNGNGYSEEEKPLIIKHIDINLFNCLFNSKQINKNLKNLYNNINLANWKLTRMEARKNYIMPIKIIES